MCGRFTIQYKWREIHAQLDAFTRFTSPARDPEPRFNIAPTQTVPIIRADGDALAVADMRWEFVPNWWREPLEAKKWSSFNAKSEGVATKPAFRGAIRQARCLVPVSAFYEWKPRPSGGKQPYAIGLVDDAPMLLGGLWNHWQGMHDNQPVEFESFAVLTTAANSFMADIHSRMPVIIQPSDVPAWVFGTLDAALTLTGDFPAQLMKAWPVSPKVGNVRNQGPELCKPVKL
jgi:putative SOS response-associated peptidase YedK